MEIRRRIDRHAGQHRAEQNQGADGREQYSERGHNDAGAAHTEPVCQQAIGDPAAVERKRRQQVDQPKPEIDPHGEHQRAAEDGVCRLEAILDHLAAGFHHMRLQHEQQRHATERGEHEVRSRPGKCQRKVLCDPRRPPAEVDGATERVDVDARHRNVVAAREHRVRQLMDEH
jgi:hypothetical protein